MTEFKTVDGAIITDELLENMAEPWDRGELSGIGGEIVRGRPRLSAEPLEVVSFKVPASLASSIAKAAKAQNCTRSEFLRDAAIEKIRQARVVE